MGVEPKWTLCLFYLELCTRYSFLPHEGSIWSLKFCKGKYAALLSNIYTDGIKYTIKPPETTFYGQSEMNEYMNVCVCVYAELYTEDYLQKYTYKIIMGWADVV